MSPITFGILTVSDTCYAGIKQDDSGPKLATLITEHFVDSKIHRDLVQDNLPEIQRVLVDLSSKCDVVLTTGGTGMSPRDVTPEATKGVIEREAAGIIAAMLVKSLQVTDMAMLSRGVCGIRGKCLIVNFPGSVRASEECFGFVKGCFQHAVDLLKDDRMQIVKTHYELQNSKSLVKINCAAFRNRNSPYKMIEVFEAQKLVLDNFNNKTEEIIDINDSLYRILSEIVCASEPLPPFPASIKDGYAVIAADGAGVRQVKDSVAAGDEPSIEELRPGNIVRISTGAAIPAGADAVVQVEDTTLVKYSDDGKEILVEINIPPTIGQDIRPIGSDIPVNTPLIQSGEIITAATIGILAAIGKTKIRVYKRLTIGVLSTGNELQIPHEKLKPGGIRDSNKLTLINLLKQYNYLANDCGIARDNPEDVKAALITAFKQNDVLVTTGGVSMGEYDVVKDVLKQDFNATIHFGRVNMKPGKPTTFATCLFENKEKFIFALPGNPVSATVTCILFVIPALRKYEGIELPEIISTTNVILDECIELDPRPEYKRAVLYREGNATFARITGNQISSRLNSLVGAQVLLALPGKTENCKTIKKGEFVEALKIDNYIM